MGGPVTCLSKDVVLLHDGETVNEARLMYVHCI